MDPPMEDERDGAKPARSGRGRRAMTPRRLRNIALYYCQRYLVSEAKLREHLEKRLRREAPDDETRTALAPHVADIAAEMAQAGLVDDREAASMRLRGALRAGYAPPAAVGVAARAARVDETAVAAELNGAIAEALPELDREALDPRDEAVALADAALRRARRGPHRPGGTSEATRRRDIAWLRRRGFRFEDIRRALGLDKTI